MSQLHPFDFDKLRKGTWIETDELEVAASCPRESKDFGLLVLNLKAQIEQRCEILCRMEGERLRLMTDSEAMRWVLGQAGKATRSLDRNSARMANVISPAELDSTDRVVHEHGQRVLSSMAAAVRAERKKNAKLFALAYGTQALEEGDDDEAD